MRLLHRWCLRDSSVSPSTSDDFVVGGRTEREESEGRHTIRKEDDIGNHQLIKKDLQPFTCFTKHCCFPFTKSTRLHLTNLVVTVGGAAVVGVSAWLCRGYIRSVLLWVAEQQVWVVILVFFGLFTLVSFPFTWGYIVINVAAGYMFGAWKGLAITATTASLGVLLAHVLVRHCFREMLHRHILGSQTLRTLLGVLGGSQAFKVVAFTRLTPIPFGLQNAVFAVSRVPTRMYLAGTVLGLLPTQALNCYLGTTVKNLDDVVTNSSSATTAGWVVFAFQILISIGLTLWIVRRARKELQKIMATSELSNGEANLSTPVTPNRSGSGTAGAERYLSAPQTVNSPDGTLTTSSSLSPVLWTTQLEGHLSVHSKTPTLASPRSTVSVPANSFSKPESPSLTNVTVSANAGSTDTSYRLLSSPSNISNNEHDYNNGRCLLFQPSVPGDFSPFVQTAPNEEIFSIHNCKIKKQPTTFSQQNLQLQGGTDRLDLDMNYKIITQNGKSPLRNNNNTIQQNDTGAQKCVTSLDRYYNKVTKPPSSKKLFAANDNLSLQEHVMTAQCSTSHYHRNESGTYTQRSSKHQENDCSYINHNGNITITNGINIPDVQDSTEPKHCLLPPKHGKCQSPSS